MAEICCDVMSSKRSRTSACNVTSRAARRRRMELRKFKFVSAKRQRCEGSGVSDVVVVGAGITPSRISGEEPEDVNPKFGVSSVCGRRREMEDATTAKVEFMRTNDALEIKHHFFGVYDGHGCSHVATSCKERMHEVVAEEMESLKLGARTQPWWRFVMERSFARMDAEVSSGERESGGDCKCEMRIPRCEHVGSTSVVAVVNPTSIVVANCGDSRAVLCRGGAAVPLSVDHKPDRPDELQRIEAAGGRVIHWDGPRVLGVLAMSRAIGDAYLKPYVISEPEITVTERTSQDEFLILASDGLWDVVSNEMACGIVRMCLRSNEGVEGEENKACSDAATLLTRVAMARQSADNISVVVVDLRRPSAGSSNSS